MNKLKVMTVVGTRPEIIRLSRVINALDREFSQTLVHTGQNYDYELNRIFFEDLEIRAARPLPRGCGQDRLRDHWQYHHPAWKDPLRDSARCPAVLGDTNSCLAAYPAKRLKIPIFHMEAGNRCFRPNESPRRSTGASSIISRTSTFPTATFQGSTFSAREFPRIRIIKTGSPMLEVIRHHLPKISGSNALAKLGLESGRYFLVSCHREENVDDRGTSISSWRF